jgi:hypothetical protein
MLKVQKIAGKESAVLKAKDRRVFERAKQFVQYSSTAKNGYWAKIERDAGRAHTKVIIDPVTEEAKVRCHDTDVININTLRGEATFDMSYPSRSSADSIAIGLRFINEAYGTAFDIRRKNWDWRLTNNSTLVHSFGTSDQITNGRDGRFTLTYDEDKLDDEGEPDECVSLS